MSWKCVFIGFLMASCILSVECTAVPLDYTVNINTNFETLLFDGVVSINVKPLQVTKELFLHSRNLTITKLSAYDCSSKRYIQIIRNTTLLEPELYVITFRDELVVEDVYEIIIEYYGRLRSDNTGFFLNHYEEQGIIGLQALTNFEQARAIFPCYDEPEYKATFTVTIRTSYNFHTISNTEVSEISFEKTRKTTQFEDTVLLSPSSLAFVISNLSQRPDNHRRNIIFARESELPAMDFSLKTASDVYDSLQKYLNASLPQMKHVAVSSEDLIARSFYGLIMYQETLIKFNPQISPDLKKIQIAKMIAKQTAQQFFGNIVTATSSDDNWVIKGLAKFLEYYGVLDLHFELEILFVIEKLQPSLNFDFTDPDGVSEDHMLDKVGCIFRMINWAIGEENFKQGLQTLLAEKKLSSISSSDLYHYLQEKCSQNDFLPKNFNIENVIESWVHKNDIAPVLLITRNYDKNYGEIRICRQVEAENTKEIWIPFNYLTENMAASNIQWLEDNLQWKNLMVPLLGPEKWIIFNVDQIGFYRVNYDLTNWELLINALKLDHTKIGEVNRAQILDDAFYLFKKELLPFQIYLNLLEYLEKEESYLPWATAIKGLQELRVLLVGSEIEEHFKIFNQNLIKELFLKVFFNGKTFMDLYMQSLATNWACDVELSECLEATLNSFNLYISSGFLISPNNQQKILCNGLKSGDDIDFQFLWRNLQSSKDLEERLNLIDVLACYPHAHALKDYLESTKVSSVEVQYSRIESLAVIKAVIARSSIGFSVSLDFLLEFQEFDILKNYGEELNEIFVEISKRIITSYDLMRMNELLVKYAQNLDPKTAQKCNEIIQNNIKWIDGNDHDIIKRFLLARFDMGITSLEPLKTTDEYDPSTTTEGEASKTISSFILVSLSVLITKLICAN